MNGETHEVAREHQQSVEHACSAFFIRGSSRLKRLGLVNLARTIAHSINTYCLPVCMPSWCMLVSFFMTPQSPRVESGRSAPPSPTLPPRAAPSPTVRSCGRVLPSPHCRTAVDTSLRASAECHAHLPAPHAKSLCMIDLPVNENLHANITYILYTEHRRWSRSYYTILQVYNITPMCIQTLLNTTCINFKRRLLGTTICLIHRADHPRARASAFSFTYRVTVVPVAYSRGP